MAVGINAGDLNRVVTIEMFVDVKDDNGESRPVARVYAANVFAAIETLSGRELERARQIAAAASVQVRIRWNAGVTPGMRIHYGSRYLGIEHVQDTDEAHVETLMLCSERK